MRCQAKALKVIVGFIIQERMQKAFSQMKAGKELGRGKRLELLKMRVNSHFFWRESILFKNLNIQE